MGIFYSTNKNVEKNIENIKEELYKYIKVLFDEKGNWNPNYEKNSKILLTMMDPEICESIVFMISSELEKLPYEEIINEGKFYKKKMRIISKTDDHFISKKKVEEKKRICNKIGLRWTRIFNILVAIALTTIYTDKRSKSQNFCETRFKSLFDLEKNESSICDNSVIYDNFYYISGLDAIVSLFDKFGLNSKLNKKLFTKNHVNISENFYFLKFINQMKNLFNNEFYYTDNINNTYDTNYIGGGSFLDNRFNLNSIYKNNKKSLNELFKNNSNKTLNDLLKNNSNITLNELFKNNSNKGLNELIKNISNTTLNDLLKTNSIKSLDELLKIKDNNKTLYHSYKSKSYKNDNKINDSIRSSSKKLVNIPIRYNTKRIKERCKLLLNDELLRKNKTEYKLRFDNELLNHEIFKKFKNSIIKMKSEYKNELNKLLKIIKKLIKVDGNKPGNLKYSLNNITDTELTEITKDTKKGIINLIKICESGYKKNLLLLLNSYEEYLLRTRNPIPKKKFYFF